MKPDGKSPDNIPNDLAGQLPPSDRRRLWAIGDVTLAGRYGLCVLAADDQTLYYGPGGGDGQGRLATVPLGRIRRVRLDNHVGNGSLVIECGADCLEVARFSHSRIAEFESAAQRLQELIGVGPDQDRLAGQSVLQVGGRKLPRCPKCGRALSPRAEVCIYCADKRKLFIRLVGLLRPHWMPAAACMLITLAVAGLHLVPPYLTKPLVARAIIPRNVSLFAMLLVGYAGAQLLANSMSIGRIRLTGWLGQRVIYDLRRTAFDRLQQLSLRYYESKQTGKLMNRITADTERIERFVVEGLPEVIVDSLTLLAVGFILFHSDWRLALITVAPTPLIAVMVYSFSKRVHSSYRRAWRMAASLSALLADVIPGVRVVKGFAREQAEAERFDRRSSRLFQHNVEVFRQRSNFFPLIVMMSQVAYIMLWAVGGWRAMQLGGEAFGNALGTLVMFSTMLWRLYEPIGRLSHLSDQVQRATTSAERVYELLDAFPEVSEPASPRSLGGRSRGNIQFRNVSFAYESNMPVLREINLTISPGEMIGVVGHSGVGKSTLASLVMRFYDPDRGQVLLDGVDIRELATAELRGNVGLVLQEPTLFHGSVRDNISYGQPDATPEAIVAAAKVANAHNFIVRLPEGYDTEVGERGVRLSQGEKQRIAIARAILRDPPILILDEATASVDTETERLIQAALDRLVQGRTVLAIAHRLSTLRNADRIIVLSEGRIGEMGTHGELLSLEGLYYQLCHAQSLLGVTITSPPAPAAQPSAELAEPAIEAEPEEVSRDGY